MSEDLDLSDRKFTHIPHVLVDRLFRGVAFGGGGAGSTKSVGISYADCCDSASNVKLEDRNVHPDTWSSWQLSRPRRKPALALVLGVV